jgi:hypothetical protein
LLGDAQLSRQLYLPTGFGFSPRLELIDHGSDFRVILGHTGESPIWVKMARSER